MVLNIPDGYFEVAFHHSLTGSLHDSVCTLGTQYTGANFVNEANGFAAAWGEHVMQSMSDVWRYDKAVFRVQDGALYERLTGFPGTTAHPAATSNTTFLIQKVTGRPGRRYHGRMYMPGVSEQDVDPTGLVVASKVTEINNNLLNFIGKITTFHFSLQLLHNRSNDPGISTTPTPVDSLHVDARAATQRNRMR